MITLRNALDTERWQYLWQGVLGQRQPRVCPCCGETRALRVDRKLVYTLYSCARCAILYRYPREAVQSTRDFYQNDYTQPGLTTDLPGPTELARLLASGFAGTSKDFSRVPRLLAALGLAPGASVLDFGANWGYGAYQFARAGYRVEAFELSRPRAAFGAKLGLQIHTSLDEVSGPFDAIYSSHVLEHVPDPLATLRDLLLRTRPGGFVLAHTPNGSEARRHRHFAGFHQHWGRVHPALLSDAFLERAFGDMPLYVSSRSDADRLAAWDRTMSEFGSLEGDELFFVMRRPAEGEGAPKSTWR